MAATAVGAPTCHRLHRLLHRPPPPSFSLSLLFKPLLISTTTTTTISPSKHLHIPHRTLLSSSLPYLPSRPLLFCYSPTLSFSATEASLQEQEETQELQIQEDDGNDGDVGEETEIEIENLNEKEDAQVGLESSLILKRDGVELPNLTVKEKKELASYAHSLGKKLKSQLVGKSGVTPSVAASFIENLESNELLKVKIHGTCPGELDDAVAQLAEATGSVVVGQIGRTVILYRPSLTKLKAEEKKLQARKVYMRKKQTLKPRLLMELQKKGERPRTYERDRRGRSRV